MYKLLSGKEFSNQLKSDLNKLFKSDCFYNVDITLGIIQVGNLEESNIYIKHKINVANEIGIKTKLIKLPENASYEEIKNAILNNLNLVTGLIIQLPMISKNISSKEIQNLLDLIPINKDIDGLSLYNINSNYESENNFLPATAKGILLLLDFYNINYKNNDISIIGQSNIVGKPLSKYLSNFNNVVRKYDKSTPKEGIDNSNVVIVATGCINPILPSNVKDGVVLVDVGIHRNNNNKISGDLDFLSFSEKASYITPVPGGVGPMTVISLILNLIKSYILQFPEQKVLFKDFLRYIF